MNTRLCWNPYSLTNFQFTPQTAQFLADLRTAQEILTVSSVRVALKFFSSIPSSTASTSLYGPFRIRTRLPAGGETTRWRGADIEVFQPPVVDQQPGTVWVFKCVCKVVGMKKYPFKRSLWFTWCGYDRLHMILVQLQFVSWVDHLHHRCVFVSHLLWQQTITAIIDLSLTSTRSHDK